MTSLDDLALLRDYARHRTPAAFAELVRRHTRMVYCTARRVTGSPDLAEDVAQDAFLRLAQRAASIRGSVAAWLHATALNRTLELVRAERARRRRETATAAAAPSAGGADEAAALIALVDDALEALPEELRVRPRGRRWHSPCSLKTSMWPVRSFVLWMTTSLFRTCRAWACVASPFSIRKATASPS